MSNAVLSTFLSIEETKLLVKKAFDQFREVGVGKYTPLCLWGFKGIGKTSLINQVLSEVSEQHNLKIKLISFQLSAMQPFDLNGYPYIADTVTLKNGRRVNPQRFATPGYLVDCDDYDYVFLFLDEINRARPEMHNALMGMLDGRGVNGHDVPDNAFLLAAANPVTDEGEYSNVTDISDEAILDRLIHINVATKQDETLQYMLRNKEIDRSIYNFLSEDRTRIQDKSFTSLTKDLKLSDRGYTQLGKIIPFIKDNMNLREAVSKGLLGDISGQMYSDRFNQYESIMQPEEILNNFNKANKDVIKSLLPGHTNEGRLDILSRITDSLTHYMSEASRKTLTKKQVKNVQAYLDLIPHDMKELFVTNAKFHDKELPEFRDVMEEVVSTDGISAKDLDFK